MNSRHHPHQRSLVSADECIMACTGECIMARAGCELHVPGVSWGYVTLECSHGFLPPW